MAAHCGAGQGRAGTLAAAMCLPTGLDLDAALVHMRTSRPGSAPSVASQAAVVERLLSPAVMPLTGRGEMEAVGGSLVLAVGIGILVGRGRGRGVARSGR